MTRKEAQQNRRSREREAAAAAANAAAAEVEAPQFEPDPEAGTDARRQDEPLPKFDRGNKVRESAMDELIAARQNVEEPVQEAENPERVESQPEPQLEPQPEPQAEPDKPATVRVKIDHEEFDVPAEEVEAYGGVKPYQIIKAQEKRLQQANALLQEAKQLKQAVPPPPPRPDPSELIKDAVAKIQISTPEEGAAALAHALKALQPQQIDPNAVTMQAVILMQATQAENAFVKDYSDLVQNPMLKQLVIIEKQRRLNEMRQQNRLPDDWNQFYTQIGNDVRAAIGRPAPSQTPTQPAVQPTITGSAAKEARKASIVALPTASARATLPEEEKPPTRAQLLDQMRKARGQPV